MNIIREESLLRIRPACIMAVLAVVSACAYGDETSPAGADNPYAEARRTLMREIEADVRRTSAHLGKDALDPRVMDAMATVPRHEFIPRALQRNAYENRPLPIGYGQTISQPYIVAIMTDLLDLPPGCTALDIGTGSGYQAAILAELCDTVYTIEIVAPLGLEAKARLERLGYDNVMTRIGDGFHGWPEHGPFDAIIVAAVAEELPPPLLAQLKPGGRMLIPVRRRFGAQELVLVEKGADEKITARDILPVIFVPLTRDPD